MLGGAGNDIYFVDNVGDRVYEGLNQGTDTVRSSVSFALHQNSQHIENLVLLGTGNINGIGNMQANLIVGNSGDNILNGGANHDRLNGFGGSDTYVLSPDAASSDEIVSFLSGDDTLQVSAAAFGGGLVGGAALGAGQLVLNTTGLAGDSNDRFILNTLTGDLYFDVDGTGGTAGHVVATFIGGIPTLAVGDFDIV